MVVNDIENGVKNGNGVEMIYIGASEMKQKKGFYTHWISLTNKKYSNNTTLASHLWKIRKDEDINCQEANNKKALAYKEGEKGCMWREIINFRVSLNITHKNEMIKFNILKFNNQGQLTYIFTTPIPISRMWHKVNF